jgi:hypothetical protein
MYSSHIIHPEERILESGLPGAWNTYRYLEYVIGQCGVISVKMDGSPAVVFGTLNETFFVATKGFFNRAAIVFVDPEAIKQYYSDNEELRDILVTLFNVFKDCPPKAIYGADVMFTRKSLKETSVLPGVSFKMNTLRYYLNETPMNKIFINRMKIAEIGLAVHSTYEYDEEINDWTSKPYYWNIPDTYDVKNPSVAFFNIFAITRLNTLRLLKL